jgi:Protein of unknown function (DUF3137)
MIEAPDVDTLMAGGLADWLDGQNAAREQAKATSRKWTISSLIAAAVVAVLVLAISGSVEFTFFAAIAIGGAGQAWAYAARKPVIDAIKQEMNGRIAAALGCEFSNGAVPGPEFETAKTFEMLPSYDRSAFEDHWAGTIGAMPFSLYEAHLEEWRGSGKQRRLETVFRGVVITIGFARDFLGVTLVERQGGHATFFGLRDSFTSGGVKMELIKMVDPRFERDFTIWSSDRVEAHYLVHPEYVERLIGIEQGFHGKKIRALFHGGDLIIALEADELFESGSLDASSDRAKMAETIGQFVSLATLATSLNERPRG